MIGGAVANEGAGHLPNHAGRLVLGDDLSAMPADESGTGEAVLASAGQDDGAEPAPIECGEAYGINRKRCGWPVYSWAA